MANTCKYNWATCGLKRVLDIMLALILLVLFSPLFLICWLMVKIEDRGPAFFKQERIGRNGKPFVIFKFRTMQEGAEDSGIALSPNNDEDDSRLTRVGRYMRAHHLDELPQLWNVLRGDMSFVGPRPERQFFLDQIKEQDSRVSELFKLRPGVTSYATLYNGYTDTMEKMLKRLELDLLYFEQCSLWYDIKIVWKTFVFLILGKRF